MLSIIDIIEDTTVDGPDSGPLSTLPDARINARLPQSGVMGYKERITNPTEEILDKVLADEFADVTFSGGDPMFQPEEFTELARAIKEKSQKNIWCYTGYQFEKLLQNPKQAALLQYIDVLVDGKFKQALHDESLLFRGSSNQRLIDVKKSLKENKVVFYNYNPFI